MKRFLVVSIVCILSWIAQVFCQDILPIVDSELVLVSNGMIVDWGFEYTNPVEGKITGQLLLDEITKEPAWSAQGCVNGYCFMDAGGPPESLKNETVKCHMRLYVPSTFEGSKEARTDLVISKDGVNLASGSLYIMSIKPLKAHFVAGEKPVVVQEVSLENCVQTKIISENKVISKTPPQIISGNMMIPFRVLGELIGAKVDWNASTNEASYTIGPKKIVLRKGINKARIIMPGFEKYLTMNASPANIKGNIMVPLRFVSNALGGQVDWDSFTNTATVNFPACAKKK